MSQKVKIAVCNRRTEQEYYTVSWIIGCVAVGGINKIGNIAEHSSHCTTKVNPCGYMVCIQQTYRAEQYRTFIRRLTGIS